MVRQIYMAPKMFELLTFALQLNDRLFIYKMNCLSINNRLCIRLSICVLILPNNIYTQLTDLYITLNLHSHLIHNVHFYT